MAGHTSGVDEVFEMALRYEDEGRTILLNAKEAVENPLAKATFDFLANEELKHIDAIKRFAETLSGSGEFDPNNLTAISGEDAKRRVKHIFERFRTAFESVGAGDQPRLETYRVAMDMERHGHDFYSRAARQSDDAKTKRLFEFLAEEEIRHFELIQDTHDYLLQPDALMAIEERWMQI